MQIATKIRELREDKDLNQTQVAKLLSTSQTVYSRYERNERTLPIEHLIKLCEIYGVSADYILGLPEDLKYPKR
ncbi:MAG: XRE family transcriptional regulator [Clostridia bacterium]|nr:XRE family transcriptional regulator [Clostridia bacterium]